MADDDEPTDDATADDKLADHVRRRYAARARRLDYRDHRDIRDRPRG